MKNANVQKLKKLLVDYLFSYDQAALHRFLVKMGVKKGDTLMVHSSWRPLNGFQGTPAQFGQTLKDIVGEEGLIVMPSLTYHNMSSAEFLASGKPMDARRSPSAMGLLTEVFRRGKGVVRSLSPTHPLLASGRDAEAFIASHERTSRPFGSNSPFKHLLDRDALILCIDTGFSSITFTHFIEDYFSETIKVPYYEPHPMIGVVIDANRARFEIPTQVISAEANKLRREKRLVEYLNQSGCLHQKRLGNTRFLLVRATDLMQGAKELIDSGVHFFDPPC